jgi:uncharacterized protein with HEPN domain
MQPPDIVFLADILDSARLVQEFTIGVSREELKRDVMRHSAVERHLEIIGEAAKNVSDEFRGEHPEIPWKKMAGMRDRRIHGYRQVNLDIVWSIATEMIPDLSRQVEPLVPPMDE